MQMPRLESTLGKTLMWGRHILGLEVETTTEVEPLIPLEGRLDITPLQIALSTEEAMAQRETQELIWDSE